MTSIQHNLRAVNDEWLERYGVNSSAPAPAEFSEITGKKYDEESPDSSFLPTWIREVYEELQQQYDEHDAADEIWIRESTRELNNFREAISDLKAGKRVFAAQDDDDGFWFLAIEKESEEGE